ncbi:hypothetical protein [Mycobacterium antarcticum]|uniref:hypothetical protein n=1 Tax=Mycolicibacterium sp. TUM20984 TaxID=3023368 RepID=UPI0024E06708|nr:hypothetical protein [Mycolicibacterium sp. TUM20984]
MASPSPTKSQLQSWQSAHLSDAAARWRESASESEDAFDRHRANVAAPGGTEWVGTAKDAAVQRVTTDLAVVRQQSAMQAAAAEIAERGAGDVRAAQRAALDAIDDAERDGFTVAENLSVIDARDFDPDTAVVRHRAAMEHAEYIRWHAERLVQTDRLVGDQLTENAGELQGIRFEGEGDPSNDGAIQAVDFKQGPPGHAESEADRRRNEEAAFKGVFGREPVSSADWSTAAALDPHSYDPDVQGLPPEIRVARVAPVPGQGVVALLVRCR